MVIVLIYIMVLSDDLEKIERIVVKIVRIPFIIMVEKKKDSCIEEVT